MASFNLTINQDIPASRPKTSKLLTIAALLFGVVGIVAFTSLSNTPSSITLLQQQLTSPQEQEVLRAYVNFIAEYGRSYSGSSHQATDRYQVFKKNYEAIKEHNKHERVLPFVMAVNQFTDMTEEEFAKINRIEIPKVLAQRTAHSHVEEKYQSEETVVAQPDEQQFDEQGHREHGHVHSEAHYKNHAHQSRKLKSSEEYELEYEREFKQEQLSVKSKQSDSKKYRDLPNFVNWVEKGAVSIPKDQKTCGSCWAFTTAATMEGLAVLSGQFKDTPSFSMQQLLDCDTSNDGCDGGWMYKAYNYTASQGMMLYEDYPYVESSNHNSCKYDAKKSVFKNIGMVQENNMSNEQLKARVAKQPVGVGIYTNTKFQFYKTGVLTEEFLECSDPKQGVNHGVTVVGYGKTKGDEKTSEWCDEYWLVKNSWGNKWGDQGFFKLCMDDTGSEYVPYGICQLNRYPTYPTMEPHKVDQELFI